MGDGWSVERVHEVAGQLLDVALGFCGRVLERSLRLSLRLNKETVASAVERAARDVPRLATLRPFPPCELLERFALPHELRIVDFGAGPHAVSAHQAVFEGNAYVLDLAGVARSIRVDTAVGVQQFFDEIRSAQRELVTLRAYLVAEFEAAARQSAPDVLVLNGDEQLVLDALDGRALKFDGIVDLFGGGNNRHRASKAKRPLQDRGLVAHRPGVGFYRPDRPPRSAHQLGHQTSTDA